ncbi:Ras-related protein Rab [Acrasis kona]|uniref:Ras-related protein Rab n=1 Tax=Acrasis kona TaxID=1008807 RepID=A0AAW2YYT5_9EUKA
MGNFCSSKSGGSVETDKDGDIKIDNSSEPKFKLVIVGDSTVGKTSLLTKIIDKDFNMQTTPTVGVDFKNVVVEVYNKKVHLQIWDTAGQERFRSIAAQYYRRANGCLLLFDITRRETFTALPRWIEDITTNSNELVKITVVGNKKDLSDSRKVTENEADMFCLRQKNNINYTEISVKETDQEAITHIFEEMAKEILNQREANINSPSF